MPRRPHLLSAREIGRLLGEHALGVALLFVGLVVGAFLRDPYLPSLFDVQAWTSAGALREHVLSFVERLGRFRAGLPGILAWYVLATLVLQFSMSLHGLYDRQPVRRARNRFLRFVRAAAVAGVVIAVVFFVARPPELGRTAIAIGYGLSVLALWTLRSLLVRVSTARPERLLILGTGPVAAGTEAAVRGLDPPAYVVVGRVGPQPDPDSSASLGGWDDLPALLERHDVDRLLLASLPPDRWDLAPLLTARLRGVAVSSARDFSENLTGEVREDELGAEFITDGTLRAYGRISRAADILLAAVLLVSAAPVLILAALAILVTAGRPVLYAQDRVGLGGLRFRCHKLRTMKRDAERNGPAWSPVDDPRVTGVGRFLRRWRIDELPQLWDVLRGDMAFVGPRPEQPYFVERLSALLPHYDLRHAVRPGLTGWAQVRHPYGASDEEARAKLRYDLFYIKHRSPWLDLAILFDTLRVVLRGAGR